jgi:hypothetical protein
MTSLPSTITATQSSNNTSDVSYSSSKSSLTTAPGGESCIHLVPLEQLPKPVDTEAQVSLTEEKSHLPPSDGGKRAWIFLAGCYLFEALVWGQCADGIQCPGDRCYR